MKDNTAFLNIDLDLVCSENLNPLLSEIQNKTFNLYNKKHNGVYKVSIEINEQQNTPEKTLIEFCEIIEKLTPKSKKIWKKCTKKCFNIGFESKNGSHEYLTKITTSTLKRVVRLEADIEMTIYSFS
ncbi:MAG: hypothetical protein H6755_04930 [Candidatus Omnitrophica bacterium]|nr:hypothetical protein [Candidatus Omnitrophota bacterium]